MTQHYYKTLIVTASLTIMLSACAETQLVIHTMKRMNNYTNTPNHLTEPISVTSNGFENEFENDQLAMKSIDTSPLPDDVLELQIFLTEQGYDTGGIDGIFGPKTKNAVNSYHASLDYRENSVPTKAIAK
jgi:hypothetical protein